MILLFVPFFDLLISVMMLTLIKHSKVVKGARLAKCVNWMLLCAALLLPLYFLVNLFLEFSFDICILYFGREEIITALLLYAIIGVIILIYNVITLVVNRYSKRNND